jgi:hypothetical protein
MGEKNFGRKIWTTPIGRICKKKRGKAIPVTGRESPEGCETSKLPHFLDSRLTDGGEVAALYLQEDSWY